MEVMNQYWCPDCKRWVYSYTYRDSDIFHSWWQTECERCGGTDLRAEPDKDEIEEMNEDARTARGMHSQDRLSSCVR